MPTIQFLPQNIQVEIESGSNLMDVLNKAQINIEYACGGTGTCGRCLVRIVSGKVDYKNQGILASTSIKRVTGRGFPSSTKIYVAPPHPG